MKVIGMDLTLTSMMLEDADVYKKAWLLKVLTEVPELNSLI